MGVLEQLRKVGEYVRKGWRSPADDSYREYKHGRERERKQAERERQDADRFAEQKRGKAEREREYEERYAAERAAEEPNRRRLGMTRANPNDPHPFSLPRISDIPGARRPLVVLASHARHSQSVGQSVYLPQANEAALNAAQEYNGGPGQIALHGLGNVGRVLGSAVSHGCVRLDNDAMRWLVRIRPGVPVTIKT